MSYLLSKAPLCLTLFYVKNHVKQILRVTQWMSTNVSILLSVWTCSACSSQPQAGFTKVLLSSVVTGEKAILKFLCWRQSSGWARGWESQCWHQKWLPNISQGLIFLCIFALVVLGFVFCAFFWKMEAIFRDDEDQIIPWAQAVTKSYSGQRPNIIES